MTSTDIVWMASSKGSFYSSNMERRRLQGTSGNVEVIRARASSSLQLPMQFGQSLPGSSDDGGGGLSTAAIVCMSIFIPLGVGLLLFAGYKYGWKRAERKYAKVRARSMTRCSPT